MITQYITNLIGACPEGYEPLQYIISALILTFIISLAYRFLQHMFGDR